MSRHPEEGDEQRLLWAADDLAEQGRELHEARENREQLGRRLADFECEVGMDCENPQFIPTTATQQVDVPSATSLDELLAPETIARLERRHVGGFQRSIRIDWMDVVASCVAGIAGGVVDILLVGIPKGIVCRGERYSGGILTALLNKYQVDSDNWLALIAKTAYDDFGSGTPISGMGGRTHRLLTPGHDPLVGLVIGTLDIMRGSRTALSSSGEFFFDPGLGERQNLGVALVVEVLHLLSDVATKMGLPAPGWTLTPLLRFGSFGEKNRTVADLARYMYLNGYDFRHFVGSFSSVAAVRMLLYGYFVGRRHLDQEYDLDCESVSKGGKINPRHPRYKSMRLIADGIACTVNAGKAAVVYQGNPLAFNYAQWLALVGSSTAVLADRLESVSDVLVDRATAGSRSLDEQWDALYAQLLRESAMEGE